MTKRGLYLSLFRNNTDKLNLVVGNYAGYIGEFIGFVYVFLVGDISEIGLLGISKSVSFVICSICSFYPESYISHSRSKSRIIDAQSLYYTQLYTTLTLCFSVSIILYIANAIKISQLILIVLFTLKSNFSVFRLLLVQKKLIRKTNVSFYQKSKIIEAILILFFTFIFIIYKIKPL